MKKTAISKSLLSAAILAGLTVPSAWSAEYTTFAENTTAQKQISNLSMYQLVASMESLPQYGSQSAGSLNWYDYAHSLPIRNGFTGAIWYMQTENANGNIEWALVEAPNYTGTGESSFYKLGVARHQTAGDVVNMAVTGTNFYTSYDTALMPLFDGVTADADGVKSIKNSTLLIESWPYGYSAAAKGSVTDQDGNTITLSGASSSDYDWNDTPNTSNDHGSWQFHVYDQANSKGQTVLSVSRQYRPKETICAGVGNSNSGTSKDWTMAATTAKAGSVSFQVLALPNYIETDRIFNADSATSDWSSADAWLGADGNTASMPTEANDVFVNYGNLIISGEAKANIMDITSLGSVTVTESGNLSVSGVKYKDGTETNPRINGNLTSYGTVFIQDHIHFSDNATLNILGGTFSTNGQFRLATGTEHYVTANFENASITGNIAIAYGGTSDARFTNATHSGGIYVGHTGTGTLLFHNSVQSGDVNIAETQNSFGTMTVTGADSKITCNNFNVGYKGTGTFVMYDGSLTANSYFCVGNNQTYAKGSVTQYGGSIQSPWFPLGHNGSGTWDMHGGSIRATGTGNTKGFVVGDKATATFVFNMDGGSIDSAGYYIVGNNGKGTLNLSGDGTITVGDYFTIGYRQNSVGTVNMTGGNINTRQLGVGDAGSGTLNFYDGTIKTTSWFLIGFNNQASGSAKNVVNQYGGTLDAGWFTLMWDNAGTTGEYNMFGGELYARGNGNPMIIGKSTANAAFNLYDGQVSAAVGQNSNQGNNAAKYNGYGVTVGGHAGAGQLNIFAGDMDVKGKMSLTSGSSLNFETSVKGLGTLAVEGAFEQNGGKVSVAHNDAISFTDDYSLENGKDIMTVGGKTAVTVTNDSANLLETAYDTATGKLNVQFKDDANRGSIGGNSGLSFAPTTAGWVELEDFNTSNPFILELLLDTNGMEIDAFVDILNAELNPSEEELWVVAEASGLNSVKMEFAPNELVGMDVLSWDFSSTDLYGANGVAVIGLDGNEVPEPSAWILLALGCGLLAWTRNRKKA